MKITQSYALVFALILGTCSCQTAHKPVASVPAKQANAPAIAASTKTPAVADTKPAPVVAQNNTEEQTAAAPADQVAALIAQVEEEYKAGDANYTAGKKDAAQENFDRAFDLLL